MPVRVCAKKSWVSVRRNQKPPHEKKKNHQRSTTDVLRQLEESRVRQLRHFGTTAALVWPDDLTVRLTSSSKILRDSASQEDVHQNSTLCPTNSSLLVCVADRVFHGTNNGKVWHSKANRECTECIVQRCSRNCSGVTTKAPIYAALGTSFRLF